MRIYLDDDSTDEDFQILENNVIGRTNSKEHILNNDKVLNMHALYYGNDSKDFSKIVKEYSLLRNICVKNGSQHQHPINFKHSQYSLTLEDEDNALLEDLYPNEKHKTFLAAFTTFLSFILTLLSISLVHDRVPNRQGCGPLPDIFLNNIPSFNQALNISEYILISLSILATAIILFHKYRFIVFRRIFLIMSILYLYRAITMFVTVLPIASKTYVCAPQTSNATTLDIFKRVLILMSGFGLSLSGKHIYCGDFIYSGHTVTFILCSLTISEYTPKNCWLLHRICWTLSLLGILTLELSHAHYIIDVLIAYFVTTRLFWIYHTLANNSNLKICENNYLSRIWWFQIFLYFEKNVKKPIPNEFFKLF